MPLNIQQKQRFQQLLGHWYRQYGRDLPWRRTTDPYAILVSEIMLQQTQVERVLEYYQRFLSHFPTLAALAEAPLSDVIEAWQGLGYYRRAQHLHQAAKHVMEQYQGVFPDTFKAVAALPGVGRYTASAILCFAFGQRAPILDTNVERVLTRVFVRRAAGKPSTMQKRLWQMAQDILPHGTEAWVINQAMMDLGATVCTARIPRCTQCCLQVICAAAPALNRQIGLFAYPEITEDTVPLAAEAATPEYRRGTPPPDFSARSAENAYDH